MVEKPSNGTGPTAGGVETIVGGGDPMDHLRRATFRQGTVLVGR